MSAADIALLALGAYLVVRGLMRGLTGEAFSLVGIVGSLYCSMTYSTPLAHLLSAKWGLNPLIAATITIVAIFLAVLLFCAVMGMQVKKLLKETKLSHTDTLLGGVSGLLKTILIVLAVLVVAIVVSPLTGNAWVRDSKILMGAAQILPVVYPPLEERGLVPNIEKLRIDTVNFIMSRTISALTDDDSEPEEPEKTPDEAELAEKARIAERADERRKSLVALGQRLSLLPASPDGTKSKDKSYRRRVLEYFIGPGAEWKGDRE